MTETKMADGENILYHYIQKNVETANEESLKWQWVVKRLIADLSIWLPVNYYRRCPVLLPYVVRDRTCRKRYSKTGREEWGSPNEKGFFRDDNSLIKAIPRSFPIESRILDGYNKKKLGKGFVACHVWQKLRGSKKKTTDHYKTNSFVPNLVWLPKQVSKLTDRDGSFAQRYLQFLSFRIYGSEDVNPKIKELWKFFEIHSKFSDRKIDFARINFFRVSEDQIAKKIDDLYNAISKIENVAKFNPTRTKKLHCSRYLVGLKSMKKSELSELQAWLDEYKQNIG